MARFLTTLEISARIERIVREAKEELILVSPYLKMNKLFYDRLKDADNRGVRIKYIYGKQDLYPDQLNELCQLKNLEVFYCENLHAKCYCKELAMVITSLNLLEFSQHNNREMGIFIKKQKEQELYDNALTEIISIINSSNKEILRQTSQNIDDDKMEFWSAVPEAYHCIRCGRIRNYPADPYCKKCYFEWKDEGKQFTYENYCQACGKQYKSTFDKPLCDDCYYGRRNIISKSI